MAKLNTIEGISLDIIRQLQRVGIGSAEQLLEVGRTREGVQALSQQIGIRRSEIERWVGQAELARINGIGPEYAALLVKANVGTVRKLATKEAQALHEKLAHYKRSNRKIRRTPAIGMVESWIETANKLQPIVDL